ncbi:MAG: TonB-dependent receptor [Mucilaginibacter sp.]
MRFFLIIGFFISTSIGVFAQGNGKISGKIIDAQTKEPVDYATISIFKAGVASPFNGTITDSKGAFTLKNIPDGEYSLRIDFVGYKPSTVDHIVINSSAVTVVVPTIVLAPASNELNTVNVVAKTPIVENKIDKLVYNAANDLTAQGGVALDVLKKVPMVNVDIDGNVELQGDANIRFLINGKPSSIFGASLADALQSIPASQIKSIEVITSPGAKYDASGTGGIINIILKDSKVQGFNGSVNVSAGTRLDNGSVNLNVRKGNFGVNAFFSGNKQLNATTASNTDRLSYNNTRDTLTHLLQNGNSGFVRSGHQSGINFNWSITPKDELTAGISFNHFNNHTNGLTTQEQQRMLAAGNNIFSDIINLRSSETKSGSDAVDMSLGYKKTFKAKDQELDVLFTTSSSNNTSNYSQRQDYLTGGYPSSGSMANNPGKNKETDITIDYAQPISENFLIETGAKGVFEDLNTNVTTDTLLANQTYGRNSNQTYGFNYSRKVFAYYLSASFSLFKFIDGKAGLRDEYTTTTADFPGTHIPAYNTIAPSFTLQHKFDATQSIKFSFTYRIERPDYGDLNPFYNISDPHNISTGNPNLRPEIGHNYEIGYNKSFDGGGNIYAGLTYRYNTDDMQTFTTFAQVLNINGTNYSNVFLNQRYNIGSQLSEGLNMYGSLPIGKLSLRTNIQLGERSNTNPTIGTVKGFAARANLNATYQFGHNLTAEAFGNYNSSQKNLQGVRPSTFTYNLAVRKQFLNKKASIGLTAANPFNEFVNQRSTTVGANFNQSSLRAVPYRTFGISISYKFGKLEFKKEKEKDDNNNNNGLQAPPEN